MRIHPSVERALVDGRPVVALESTVITHGLPRPVNATLARELEEIVRGQGAVPATCAVIAGVPCVGLDAPELSRLAALEDVVKVARRDLGSAVALGRTGGTTVSATAYLAARAGVRVFATGGLGGVHRGAKDSFDVSQDLWSLARTPVLVVSAGAKSILDLRATHELLETLAVTVVGYGTDELPGFTVRTTGINLDTRVDTPEQAAAVARAQWDLGLDSAVLLMNPPPAEHAIPAPEHERALQAALTAAQEQGVQGKAVTPFLLEAMKEATHGLSLTANLALLRSNAELAARVAAALTR